ncbi:MAG: glutamate-5-semialdehyde dehydrogenase [Bacteroidales bacterium]|nr:glutamate-5-semialdehyde dehydrogenase [Bacteroidales bacterium]
MPSQIFIDAKQARAEVARLQDSRRNELLNAVAGAIVAESDALLRANASDLARMREDDPRYDRLLLDRGRLEGIASDMRAVAGLPSPLGRVLAETVRPNGLKLKKISVPFGVIGMIYEARPNVTFDVFSLCLKSGNVCLLKGSKDADDSNRAEVALIKKVLKEHGVTEHAVNLLPSTHEATGELLAANGYVDLVIPRGGRRLIDFVRDNAKVPCIETGAGVVNTYFDESGDLAKGKAIVTNAKTRRVSVCNALDCLIVHSSRLPDLPELCSGLAAKDVVIYADERALAALRGHYPATLLLPATEESFGTEFMNYKMAIRCVDSLDEALAHIAEYGSGHSESIVSEDDANVETFLREVDAACVYANAPTSFTDGAQFGLGAEIGISTQKLGARGPMGLEEITSYKWIIHGNGQTRP